MKFLVPLTLCLCCVSSPLVAQIPEMDVPHELHSLPHAPLIYLDDTTLTVGNLGDYLFNAGVHPAGQHDRDLDTLRKAMDAYIDEVIITRDLDSAAIMSDPKARWRLRWRMSHIAGPVVYSKLVGPHVSVSREEIEKFYQDSLKSLFTAPTRREVRHILISPKQVVSTNGKRSITKEQIKTAELLADSLKTLILGGRSFDSLAAAFSDDSATAVHNGYLGWIYPGNTVFDFDTAAFAAQVGEVRGPVKSLYGYHLIKVEQVRPESTIVLSDSLSTLISRQLEFAKGRAQGTVWADSVLKTVDWRFNDSALALVPRLDADVWLLAMNDRDTMCWADWNGAWQLYQHAHNIDSGGTLEDMHASLKESGFPFLYLQIAEDLGFADDPKITTECTQYLRSEALRLAKDSLRQLQEPPADLVDPTKGLKEEKEPEKPLHLQMVRAADSATIWSAYRALVAGDPFDSVARRFHDNKREAAGGLCDLGWVGPKDVPADLWSSAWILEPGRYTRPLEHNSRYYIYRLVDRYKKLMPLEVRNREIDSVRAEYAVHGLSTWRHEIRSGHRIRLDQSYWKRVQQLWRP